jgi:hypothetical protein
MSPRSRSSRVTPSESCRTDSQNQMSAAASSASSSPNTSRAESISARANVTLISASSGTDEHSVTRYLSRLDGTGGKWLFDGATFFCHEGH